MRRPLLSATAVVVLSVVALARGYSDPVRRVVPVRGEHHEHHRHLYGNVPFPEVHLRTRHQVHTDDRQLLLRHRVAEQIEMHRKVQDR
jgi:hypothetical protein